MLPEILVPVVLRGGGGGGAFLTDLASGVCAQGLANQSHQNSRGDGSIPLGC